MEEFIFVKDYKEKETLRESFFELANDIFGIHFESWYENGFWGKRYIPYSFIVGEKVVANVSVNLIDFVIEGKKKHAIQIGTVMTHPEYRNRGLSANLLRKVIDDYEDKVSFFYLFANKTVLEFYPKFGFEKKEEDQFFIDYSSPASSIEKTNIRKLDGTNVEDIKFIYQFASKRIPVSQQFGTENTQELLMFYCLNVFSEHIYYIEQEEAIVLYIKEDEQIEIFDIVSKKEINIEHILRYIADEQTKKIIINYTPDYKETTANRTAYHGSEVLFVKENDNHHFPKHRKHPITAQA